MQLPKLNGMVDAEEVADMIVTHILATVGISLPSDQKRELEQYTQRVIEVVKRETTNQ